MEIPQPPKELYVIGSLDELLTQPLITIVGSRKVSNYGRTITAKLAKELAERGVVIVSGLALGVDSIAHTAAIEAGGKTLAVLPSSLDKIYPSSHTQLAKRILETGGVLLSEYPEGTMPVRGSFIARNRLVSGISLGVIITEAAEKSGTLHTANFALEQGKTVMAVPGNITSELSTGTNNLIKVGAVPITSTEDVLNALNLELSQAEKMTLAASAEEAIIIKLIQSGTTDGSELQVLSKLPPPQFNQTLTMLEITGKIRALGGGHWSLA